MSLLDDCYDKLVLAESDGCSKKELLERKLGLEALISKITFYRSMAGKYQTSHILPTECLRMYDDKLLHLNLIYGSYLLVEERLKDQAR